MPARRWMWTALIAALGVGPATAPVPLGPGDHLRRLTVDGRPRSYLVHVPPSYDPAKPTPVVVAFHGALMNGLSMAWFTGLSRKADASGFIVVYPNGVGIGTTALFFNAGARPAAAADAGPPDDVKFTDRLLDDLASVANVDAHRIFATGMSNGGMMANRVAAELSNRIAAAAPVAGTLALPAIHPARPVPIMIFHGTADGIVPFLATDTPKPATMQFRSVAQTVRTWADADGCRGEGRTVETPDSAHDGTTVTTTTYGPAAQGADVVLVKVNGGGHTWPGEPPPVKWIGPSTHNASANDLMWAFFQRHPMP